jgi:excisionase family DNA binding protein
MSQEKPKADTAESSRLCAICSIDPQTGARGTTATNRICPKCRMDPANVDWLETVEDRGVSPRFGMMEEFLFENIRRIIREEVRGALAEMLPKAQSPAEDASYLSISEAAKIAGLHHGTIREWIKDGSLKAFRTGRVYRIRRADLDERLTAQIADPVAMNVEERVTAILAKRAGRAA